MKLTTAEIAQMVSGQLEGDPSLEITRLASLENGEPGSISFLADQRYTPHIYNTASTAVLVANDFVAERQISSALIRVPNPYRSFHKILTTFFSNGHHRQGLEQPCTVAEGAVLGEGVYVGAYAYIAKGARIGRGVQIYPNCYIGENVVIGENSILYPNVSIYYGCTIGANCILHAGVVLGADGFGFIQEGGKNIKVPQIGNVVLEDEVELGANTCVDRAAIGSTVIRRGVKVDNLVQLAHNIEVGENTILAAQVGISGSTKLGRNCLIAGQVGITSHIQLADFTQVGAQSGVSKNVITKGKSLRGSPARELKKQLKIEAYQMQVPELLRQLEQLRQEVEQMKRNAAN